MKADAPFQRPETGEIDFHFARLMARFGGDGRWLRPAAAALCQSVREKHICLTLARLAGQVCPEGETAPRSAAQWRVELERSSAVGAPAANTPLVLDAAGRLYLRRYWNYQAKLAEAIRLKCGSGAASASPAASSTQDEAIEAALRQELIIICGGPGTGKTSTVTRLLWRLLNEPGGDHLRIGLAAPTGKAASRLDEAVRQAVDQLAPADRLRALMPTGARTIHRLLGSRTRGTSFWHNVENPLPLDVLIVDEASMVSLAVMAKLFDALPARCRLLLLGDRDQLASVEPGAVLADVIDAAGALGSPLRGSVITLTRNYRFRAGSGIALACEAVRRGEADAVPTLLRSGQHPDVVSTELSQVAELHAGLGPVAVAGFGGLAGERDPAAALRKLGEFRVLTPLRHGAWGVTGLNRFITQALAAANLMAGHRGDAYAGRPILILQNDYELDLYNGDLGVVLPDPAETETPDQLYAWFIGPENRPRRWPLARLPEHETAYAMTVHKSQGSEFERVLFVLPENDSPLLTRELVYTALTRARTGVEIYWSEPVLRAAVGRRAERESGLADLLNAGG
jgi:exodeoxyribonuclease V alpha subunit